MVKKFTEFIQESVWGDLRKKSLGQEERVENVVTYEQLENENATVQQLYTYLIQNYKPTGEREIKLESGQAWGDTWYEVSIPVSLLYGDISTEINNDDFTKIYAVDFPKTLKKYILAATYEEMEGMNSETYERVYLSNKSDVMCNEVVDFLDELLNIVPDPALEKKKR